MKLRVKNLVFANFCHLQFNLIGHHSLQAVRAVANLFIILLFIVTIYSLINLRRTEKFVKIITHILNTFYLISCLFFFIYTFSRSIPPPLPSFFVSNWNEWKFKKKRCISRIKIRTIRTFRTILGLQNKKSVQSVHFGHPAYLFVPISFLYWCSLKLWTLKTLLSTLNTLNI